MRTLREIVADLRSHSTPSEAVPLLTEAIEILGQQSEQDEELAQAAIDMAENWPNRCQPSHQ